MISMQIDEVNLRAFKYQIEKTGFLHARDNEFSVNEIRIKKQFCHIIEEKFKKLVFDGSG